MALKVFIADDDAGMRLVLRKIIDSMEGFSTAGEAADGEEAVRLCAELEPDVVFLDVRMPGLSGNKAARQISDLLPETEIIFVTAHSEYMPEAFEVYAFDYLLKPFKVDRVRQTLRRLRKKRARVRASGPPAIMVKCRESMAVVPVRDILLVYREGRKTQIVTSEEEHTSSESLNSLWQKLDNGDFFRCHRAYIIRLSAISRIYPYGRWTYIAKLKGTDRDALITREKLQDLEELMGRS
jgi:two-component system LytT family response regulator